MRPSSSRTRRPIRDESQLLECRAPIPEKLAAVCSNSGDRRQWLAELPYILANLQKRWSFTLGPPFDGKEVSCAWVAPVVRHDNTPAVLKIGLPHMEAEHEIEGLRFWAGDPTVHLLEADESLNAMLLESCRPGTHLRYLPEAQQDRIIAALLCRLWRTPAKPHRFRPLDGHDCTMGR